MKSKLLFRSLLSLGLMLTIFFTAHQVQAGGGSISTWTGGAGTSDWNTAANWSGTNGGSAPPGDGDEVKIETTTTPPGAWPVYDSSSNPSEHTYKKIEVKLSSELTIVRWNH